MTVSLKEFANNSYLLEEEWGSINSYGFVDVLDDHWGSKIVVESIRREEFAALLEFAAEYKRVDAYALRDLIQGRIDDAAYSLQSYIVELDNWKRRDGFNLLTAYISRLGAWIEFLLMLPDQTPLDIEMVVKIIRTKID